MRRGLAQAFRAARLDAPALDARLLIGHALGLDHTALAGAADRGLT
ncbi:MAG: protein-(glutamine-N5) methyltransferase, release factor-specific, partial [Rhodoplanes sp.]